MELVIANGPSYETVLFIIVVVLALALGTALALGVVAAVVVGPGDGRARILPTVAAGIALVLVAGHPGDKGVALPIQAALVASFVTALIQRAAYERFVARDKFEASWFSLRWLAVGALAGILIGGAGALASADPLLVGTLAISGGVAAGSLGAQRY
jgi:hypothetical protein